MQKLITNPENWHSSFQVANLPPIPQADMPEAPLDFDNEDDGEKVGLWNVVADF